MKRQIKGSSNYHQVVVSTGKTWQELLENIERDTGLKVDSAYRRRPSQWIELIDEVNGRVFDAEINKYHDGTFEFRSDNMS